jgi:hypothetical protein
MHELPNKYLNKKQAIEKYNFLSANMLKNLLFKDHRGFRSKVVRKVGRRVLLDEQALLRYIAEGAEDSFAK